MKKRIFTIFLTGLLLCGMLPTAAFAATGATVVPGTDADKFTIYGRTVTASSGALRLFWTNSGFAVKVNGTAVTADISVNNTSAAALAYLNVYVDGAFSPTATLTLDRTTGTYTLAEGLSAGEHIIEVRKRNEANYGGSATVTVNSVTTDGTFLTPPAKAARQIEFIGDSITSGFGNMVTDGSGAYFTTAAQDGTMTWAVLAAKQLGAEAQVVSRSGIGYCRNTVIHGTTDNSFYPYYTKTAVLPGTAMGNAAWDFESHPSDVVVINLGTNDSGGTRGGVTITDAEMAEEAVAFLTLVREKNPDAVIIWHYGLMGTGRAAAFEDAVAAMNDAGDDKIFFLQQTPFSSLTEGVGIHGHPTVQACINRSDELARFIAEKMGWEWNAAPMLQAQLQWSAQYNNETALADLTPASAAAFTDAIAEGEQLLSAADTTNEELVAASEAVWRAWSSRRSLADMSSEYIVVDDCDETRGVQLGGNGQKGFDAENKKEGTYSLSASGYGTVCINHVNSYNITMPTDAKNWFFECWLYIDDPAKMPAQSVLEVSQVYDVTEVSWNLNQLGLEAGWNKLQLPLTALPSGFETLRSVRLFLVDPTESLTVKLDHMVLAKGRAAADTAALDAALAEAEAFLKEHESATLAAAVADAEAAVSQADADASVLNLARALAAAQEEAAVRLGDVDGNKKIDSTDARLTLQYAVGKIGDDALVTAAADVDGNKKIDSTDARLILQYAVGKISNFTASE